LGTGTRSTFVKVPLSTTSLRIFLGASAIGPLAKRFEEAAMGATESPYMPQEDAAEFLHLSPRTLERMRVAGTGPSFLKFGRRVAYARADLIAWAEGQRHKRTARLRGRKALS
jgi:hypothetical protein